MAGSDDGKLVSKSVALAAEKVRAQRVQRLHATLEKRLENPLATIDALMAEVGAGYAQADLWEALHASAIRDGLQEALADAYTKCVTGPRMKRLTADAQAQVLMHAADYVQGVLGDAAKAEGFLERVVAIVPTHGEAFGRLERRFEKILDARRLVELYALVAAAPPRAASILATQVQNRLLQLTPKDAISDEACRRLVSLVPQQPRLLDTLEAHCRATKRHALAAELIEAALATPTEDAVVVQRRHRLLDLYIGEAASPSAAIVHVEVLLAQNPSDPTALKYGERLLSTREVSSRAADALRAARRTRGH